LTLKVKLIFSSKMLGSPLTTLFCNPGDYTPH
jgi:hypothetical protein